MTRSANDKRRSRAAIVALRLTAAAATGFLLWAAFPPMADEESVWLALIPILLVARYVRGKRAFFWGWLAGMMAWAPTLWWLLLLGQGGAPWIMVGLGWLLLSAYCAMYTGLFTVGAAWVYAATGCHGMASAERIAKQEEPPAPGLGRFAALFLLPIFWVGLEYIRGTFATGFPWHQLGISQFRNISVIQIAEFGGVYAVSAVIVLVNAALSQVVSNVFRPARRRGWRRVQWEFALVLVLALFLWQFGMYRAESAANHHRERLIVCAVQPSIPQYLKWATEDEAIRETYMPLLLYTRMASVQRPDLVIWPETAVPDWMPYSRRLNALIGLVTTGSFDAARWPEFAELLDHEAKPVPILFGAMEETKARQAYNSVFLFSREAELLGSYRKRHLVPIGEYVPWQPLFRWLDDFVPLGFPCLPGEAPGVLALPLQVGGEAVPDKRQSAEARLGVIICFESLFPYLARDTVKAGAQLLVNQTNDAWFDGSSAAVQHMTHSVFRAVENRVSVVRVANTGITCAISPAGRIDPLSLLKIAEGEADARMYRTFEAPLRDADAPLTFYTRFGDWPFAIPCALLTCAIALSSLWQHRRLKRLARAGTDATTNKEVEPCTKN